MKKRLLVFIGGGLAICCSLLMVYRPTRSEPTLISRAQLVRLLDARTQMTGTMLFDARSPMVEIQGSYQEPLGGTVRFLIKTDVDDAMTRRLIESGIQTREATHGVARAVSRLLELARLN